MGINTSISRIVHLCAQNCEFLDPSSVHTQTHTPQCDLHAQNRDTQGQSLSGVAETNRIVDGFMLLSWWTKKIVYFEGEERDKLSFMIYPDNLMVYF